MNEFFSYEEMKDENRIKAGLGYLVFFLPFILCKGSKLGRFCANQGLLLLIVQILTSCLLGIFTGIPLIGWMFRLAARLVRLAILVVGLLCMLQLTTNKKAIEIPFVGGFRIIR